MEATQRMVPLDAGKRVGVKLDSATWQAIDWLSGQSGQTWQQWCADVIAATPEDENMTAAIRAAAMDGILAGTIMATRKTIDNIANDHPMLAASAIMDDGDLVEHMGNSEIHGSEDFGGFTIHAGMDEFKRPCIWIENNVKGCPSVVLPMPGGDE